MYRRFLNNNDYLGVITPEALAQFTRGNDDRFIQAEEEAEMSSWNISRKTMRWKRNSPRGNTSPITTGASPIPWACISTSRDRYTRSSAP